MIVITITMLIPMMKIMIIMVGDKKKRDPKNQEYGNRISIHFLVFGFGFKI